MQVCSKEKSLQIRGSHDENEKFKRIHPGRRSRDSGRMERRRTTGSVTLRSRAANRANCDPVWPLRGRGISQSRLTQKSRHLQAAAIILCLAKPRAAKHQMARMMVEAAVFYRSLLSQSIFEVSPKPGRVNFPGLGDFGCQMLTCFVSG